MRESGPKVTVYSVRFEKPRDKKSWDSYPVGMRNLEFTVFTTEAYEKSVGEFVGDVIDLAKGYCNDDVPEKAFDPEMSLKYVVAMICNPDIDKIYVAPLTQENIQLGLLAARMNVKCIDSTGKTLMGKPAQRFDQGVPMGFNPDICLVKTFKLQMYTDFECRYIDHQLAKATDEGMPCLSTIRAMIKDTKAYDDMTLLALANHAIAKSKLQAHDVSKSYALAD
ncbi:unnamed protein product [Vitrella brassicaformis CCMP3155]|uniref:Uncharacterized protein n=2 Tax=Vitrella brassicaformis TaxID=1169539 RepID=A0A0G4GMI2_VITBC|nr:unnamed protein product [Vitrella brassicaformis CCMP3155]|eukprot:CEM31396.1 unnamed protein product [Vitrella brassicaformis CCMP3155]